MSQISLRSSAQGSDYIAHESIHTPSDTSTTSTIAGRANPFATPALSYRHSQPDTREGSIRSSASIIVPYEKSQDWFRSRRTAMRTKQNRRQVKRAPQEKWLWIIPAIGLLIGLGIAGYLIYGGLEKSQYSYKLILDEDFSTGVLDSSIWTIEQEVGGFGNEQFEQTTALPENVFIKDGMLYLQPTLQNASLIENNSTINLTATGLCTSNYWANCVTSTNTTNGTIVQPVRSARLNTKLGASIKYGRVEVTAKIPKGDWLWPAIWLLPVDSVYGEWPQSGEIDIMESRGNNYTYPGGGNNFVSSSLHYGPDYQNDAYITTLNRKAALHSQYGDDFHVYGLEWTPDHIFTYVDSRLLQVMYIKFNEPFWNRGHFPAASQNGTLLLDPWASTSDYSAPFDQFFYLILDVAVGGQNGWFTDGEASKPWVDASPFAKRDFYNDRDQWEPTWKDSSAMLIKKIQMWQQE